VTTRQDTAGPADVGVFGLGVMGRSLALNIERNGFRVAVFDRELGVAEEFVAGHPALRLSAARTPAEFVRAVARPRKIVLLVKAGPPVDWTVGQIAPLLEPGDVIVDGGNSHFRDTERRERELKTSGVHFVGSGISGGERGALWGPSLMPGGERAAYELIRPVWEAIAARAAGGPCVAHAGPGGAGHFVKTVHNGIEYGDMQLIAEAYDLLRRVLRMPAAEIADVFDVWNAGELESYLVEITAKILRVRDAETGRPLVDLVLDRAGQKGTGRWASQSALELGVPVPTINAAVDARNLAARREERVEASRRIRVPQVAFVEGDRGAMIGEIRDALHASKICNYAQGMNLIRAASEAYGWGIDLAEIARIWTGGCIIRARLLGRIRTAYEREPRLPSLLLDPDLNERLAAAQAPWRRAVASAVQIGVPAPAMSASLAYFDTYRAAELPLNLTQAQRDFFGSHTYERTDRPGAHHTDWEELSEAQRGAGR
jgi:6-phosphogluconate dehydrogenase